MRNGIFTRDIIHAAVELSQTPTGNPLLDRLFLSYNEVSPREDSPVYYRFLFHLARLLTGERLAMLELGCKLGSASLHFLKGGGAGCLAVDCLDVLDHDLIRRETKPGSFMFLKGLSFDPALLPIAESLNPNIIFIDTGHYYKVTQMEYALWRPFARKGGIMLFDDICAKEFGCSRFWNEIEGDKLTFPDLHPRGWGFGVLFT